MAALAAARAGEAPLIAPPMFFTESYSSGKEAARAALAAAQAGEAPLVAIPWECGPSTDAALDQVWPEALVCGTAALLACADDWRSAAEVATADGRGEAAEAAARLLWGKHTVGKAHPLVRLLRLLRWPGKMPGSRRLADWRRQRSLWLTLWQLLWTPMQHPVGKAHFPWTSMQHPCPRLGQLWKRPLQRLGPLWKRPLQRLGPLWKLRSSARRASSECSLTVQLVAR